MYWGLNPNTKSVYPYTGSIGQWSKMMDLVEKVGDDRIRDIHISTVFLGVNHASNYGRPILFETMIFGGGPDYESYQERYDTYEEALNRHKEIVEQVTNEIPFFQRKTLKIKF
jgi:L-ribulose-5-phosphate 3-epimerase UlaE